MSIRITVSRIALVFGVVAATAGPGGGRALAADGPDSAAPTEDQGAAHIDGGLYLDLGYLDSSTRPGNHIWRSKGTSNVLDRLRVNNATLWVSKDALPNSRWGFQAGLQAGADVDAGVPPEDAAIDGAETLGYLNFTNLSYLFPLGQGLELTGGLIPGFPGYPGFYAIENPSYTRPYAVDYTPYFLWGLRADYPVSAKVSGSLFVISGWDYLKSTNNTPGYGFQLGWQVSDQVHATQNFYYGSEQKATAMEFWRFATDTNVEWQAGQFLVAASFTHGNERQAAVSDQPRYAWTAAALWLQWRTAPSWRFTLRPEWFDDPDGLQTGARQTLTAVAATAEYRLTSLARNAVSARAELRFDHSTGQEGGFFEGDDNRLVPDQRVLALSLLWKFDSGGK